MKSQGDQELVKLLARGDQRAFETVFERCRLPVFRFALHMSGSREIADEVTQDAFLFLLRKPESFSETKGTLQSFLMGVARNLVRRSRRDATDDVPLEEESIDSLEQQGEGPLEHAMRRQSAEALQAALLQVPEAYREAIVLCDLQELSYAEAAALLGVPVGTVRSRLHRGHLALVDQLSRDEVPQKSGTRQ
jgi:RNA polymerase sigma-70 factor (ECF subfamily)